MLQEKPRFEKVALLLFQDKVLCPRCDGNGFIYQATIIPLAQEIFMCDECDALWLDKSSIENNSFYDFTSYVESHGYSYEHVTVKNSNYY